MHALGVVLWECLTHGRAFLARDVMAVLARVLFEVLPPPSEKAAGIPDALDALVVRLLAKRMEDRPASATEVLAALDAVAAEASGEAPAPARVSVLSGLEQRVVSVVVGAVPETSTGSRPSALEALRARVDPIAARHGARLEVLGDGGLVALVEADGGARQSAVQAARLARALGRIAARLAVSTGRVVRGEGVPVGDAIDRAAALVALPSPAGAVRLDDTSAAALADDFEVVDTGDALYLGMPRAGDAVPGPEHARLEGRAPEIAAVAAALDEARREGRGRAVVMLADPGMGKTRLAGALAVALAPAAETHLARGDAMRSGSPYDAFAPALREALGASRAEGLEAARAAVLAAAATAAGDAAPELAVLLGEVAGVPFPAPRALEALRADPRQLASLLAAAVVRFVRARARRRPVVLLLDDAQWADRASVALLEACVRSIDDAPVLAVVLARPDLDDAHPGLFADAPVDRRTLPPLPAAAAARVVASLAPDLDDAQRDAVVRRAAGSPLFLRELVRARRRGAALPESVLATVQMRLDALDAEARRVLRAASVLGARFFVGAVEDLVGADARRVHVGRVLHDLAGEGLVEPVASRLAGHRELSFESALVRDACYATLTEDDRRRGHRRAARWLAAHGEEDPALLARHLDEAGDAEEAAAHHLEAARRALAADDLAAVVHHAERAQSAADPRAGAAAAVLEAEARIWEGAQAEARRAAERALAALTPGEGAWLDAVAVWLDASAALGDRTGVEARVEALLDVDPDPLAHAQALARAAPPLVFLERSALAAEVERRAEALARGIPDAPLLRARLANARAIRAVIEGDLLAATEAFRASAEAFDAAGAARWAASQRANLGSKLLELGRVEEAAEALEASRAAGAAGHFPYVVALAELGLGIARHLAGDLEGALRVASSAAEAWAVVVRDPRLESAARSSLAEILAALGRDDDAWTEAALAVQITTGMGPARAAALAVLARIALDGGDAAQALSLCEEAAGLAEGEPMLDRALYLAAVHADALRAVGREDEARRLAGAAWARLAPVAAALDPAARVAFLGNVPEHQRLAELMRAGRGTG